MFLKFEKGKQKNVIERAIARAGSERALCEEVALSKGAIYRYKNELVNIPSSRLIKILTFLGEALANHSTYITESVLDNWGKVKGGINCVESRKRSGKFLESIRQLNQASSRYMKKWHSHMKQNSPIEYHIWQYERFKKIGGGYKHNLLTGTKVRNKLEKYVGDFLLSEDFEFEYEPCLKLGGSIYFPDFRVANHIIEVTEWKDHAGQKSKKLKTKVQIYKDHGFIPIIFVPDNLRKFYKDIDCPVFSTLEDLRAVLKPL